MLRTLLQKQLELQGASTDSAQAPSRLVSDAAEVTRLNRLSHPMIQINCNPTQDLDYVQGGHPGYAAPLWSTGGTGPVWVMAPIRVEPEGQWTIFNCIHWLSGMDMDNLEMATLSITTMKGGVEETHTLTIMHATQEVGTKHPVNASILGMLDR
ncbi:hypothetical protein B0H17DRAFT_1145016 [Mycena rosella]|uniref:Uncharacterized protein n=1 Tax=Mycena rosella TaxID=1033263 RepID=A0AAD7CRP8_MYCRO|nr:hypothetical protein B0H17DRAFT_1145016 [Mycena rosella]